MHIAHRLDEVLGAARVADAPAGHAIGFGHAVHRQCTVVQRWLDLRRCCEFEIVVDEVFVHVVGQHPHVRVTYEHVGDGFQFGLRIGRAAWVRRGIEQHPFSFRRDRFFKVGRFHLETGFLRACDEHRRAFRQQHHVGVRYPIRGRYDDFVARRKCCHECVIEHLLAAGADGDLLGRISEAILALEFCDDGFFQFCRAIDCRVFGVAALNRLDRGFLDVVGRIEIRLAERERDDIFALCFERIGLGGDGDGGGGLDAGESGGEERHNGSWSFGVLTATIAVQQYYTTMPLFAKNQGLRQRGCHTTCAIIQHVNSQKNHAHSPLKRRRLFRAWISRARRSTRPTR